MKAAIVIENLMKDYRLPEGGRVRAVNGLSLEIPQGGVFGLLGPNGSGKSSTLRVALGLSKATAGSITVLGQPAGCRAVRARTGYVPEAPWFARHLTCREVVCMAARLHGLGRKAGKAATASWLSRVGLHGAEDRPVGACSKGMLQRLSLAQALVHDPELIVLDEPTAGVDPLGAADVVQLVRELRDEGKTIVLCTHLLAQVEALCDHVALLHQGHLVAQGALDELLVDPGHVNVTLELETPEKLDAVRRVLGQEGIAIHREAPARQRLDEVFLRLLTMPVNEKADDGEIDS